MWWWLWLGILAIGIGALALAFRRRADVAPAMPEALPPAPVPVAPDGKAPSAQQTAATIELSDAVFALAFSVNRFDYLILGPHEDVLNAAIKSADRAADNEKFFPRRPALLPKLLRALNSAESSRDELVRLILQDPVLAGNVLKRANSAYYRSTGPIESVERAVTVLGNDGLRAPVATAVMQPVFQLPRGFFEQFAPITWELAQRSAAAAESFARTSPGLDPFVAHLLGLLTALGRLVVFRLTLDCYQRGPHNVMPRAEVFIRAMQALDVPITLRIAKNWELSDEFVAAIDAQRANVSPLTLSPLARAGCYANLCGAMALLATREKITAEAAQQLLIAQGLAERLASTMWNAATQSLA